MAEETAVDRVNNVKQKFNDMLKRHLKRFEKKEIGEQELLNLSLQSSQAIALEIAIDMKMRGYEPKGK